MSSRLPTSLFAEVVELDPCALQRRWRVPNVSALERYVAGGRLTESDRVVCEPSEMVGIGSLATDEAGPKSENEVVVRDMRKNDCSAVVLGTLAGGAGERSEVVEAVWDHRMKE